MFVDEKQQGEVPDFKLGTLRLSTAIRIGAKIYPQGVDWMYSIEHGMAPCALCSAAYADGFKDSNGTSWVYAYERWPELCEHIGGGENLGRVIEMLNGFREVNWTREQIADWLEGQGY